MLQPTWQEGLYIEGNGEKEQAGTGSVLPSLIFFNKLLHDLQLLIMGLL
jgi:hypothetical protein